ncbi:MAG TPA: DUF3089 domain-containing protein, partial [Caulobacteraceae bacterium]
MPWRARVKRWTAGRLAGVVALGVILFFAAAAFVWREDIRRTALDPKVPFQTYRPPAAPDYGSPAGWALIPEDAQRAPAAGGADVFFVHPTTFDGGREWNGPIGEVRSEAFLRRAMLPNHAGPFLRVGRIFAPRYRQASLYAQLTLRDDAREARMFAYRDVAEAFAAWRRLYDHGRPLFIVGVGQGGELAARLVDEAVRADPALRDRLVAVYLLDVAVPAARYAAASPLPACESREQAGCVVAWLQARENDDDLGKRRLRRALVWNDAGMLEPLGEAEALCV